MASASIHVSYPIRNAVGLHNEYSMERPNRCVPLPPVHSAHHNVMNYYLANMPVANSSLLGSRSIGGPTLLWIWFHEYDDAMLEAKNMMFIAARFGSRYIRWVLVLLCSFSPVLNVRE